MQKWEYKTIYRWRGWAAREEKDDFHQNAGPWSSWSEDGKRLPTPVNIEGKLKELGEQGWELIAVEPRSNIIGGVSRTYGFTANIIGGGKTEGYSTDYAGFTNEDLWVFKRPKD